MVSVSCTVSSRPPCSIHHSLQPCSFALNCRQRGILVMSFSAKLGGVTGVGPPARLDPPQLAAVVIRLKLATARITADALQRVARQAKFHRRARLLQRQIQLLSQLL